MLSKSSSVWTKSAPVLLVIMVSIYSSLVTVVLCYTDSKSSLETNYQTNSYSSDHNRYSEQDKESSSFNNKDLFIPLIDTKHSLNAKTSEKSLENLKNSRAFKQYQEKTKVHIISSASASALLSSSTLSVDELPKPQVQKQTPTGATSSMSNIKDSNNTNHRHKHQHRSKHHSKKRHHKVSKSLKSYSKLQKDTNLYLMFLIIFSDSVHTKTLFPSLFIALLPGRHLQISLMHDKVEQGYFRMNNIRLQFQGQEP